MYVSFVGAAADTTATNAVAVIVSLADSNVYVLLITATLRLWLQKPSSLLALFIGNEPSAFDLKPRCQSKQETSTICTDIYTSSTIIGMHMCIFVKVVKDVSMN